MRHWSLTISIPSSFRSTSPSGSKKVSALQSTREPKKPTEASSHSRQWPIRNGQSRLNKKSGLGRRAWYEPFDDIDKVSLGDSSTLLICLFAP